MDDLTRDLVRLYQQNGPVEVIELLIENGADVHVVHDYPLRWASASGHLEMVKLLLDNGADVHTLTNEPLRLASEGGHTDVVELLKNHMSVGK